MSYKFIKPSTEGDQISSVLRLSDNVSIPFDPDNTDYQEYLKWAKTNTTDPVDALTWDDIRSKRDGILKDTDWTVIPGCTVDQSQWAAYRQIIRDIPQTYKDKTPSDVVWPTQPSIKGPNS